MRLANLIPALLMTSTYTNSRDLSVQHDYSTRSSFWFNSVIQIETLKFSCFGTNWFYVLFMYKDDTAFFLIVQVSE